MLTARLMHICIICMVCLCGLVPLAPVPVARGELLGRTTEGGRGGAAGGYWDYLYLLPTLPGCFNLDPATAKYFRYLVLIT